MIIGQGEDVTVIIDTLGDDNHAKRIIQNADSEPDVDAEYVYGRDFGATGQAKIKLTGEFAGILNALWFWIQGDDDPQNALLELLGDMERINP